MRLLAPTDAHNEFFAMREDLFLRMMEIVQEAGTSFAAPAGSPPPAPAAEKAGA